MTTTWEILLMNQYVLGMAQFSIGCFFNLVAFITLFTSGLARQSTGIFLIFLLGSDTVHLVVMATLNLFMTEWIYLDIFLELGGSGGIALCKAWNFLLAFTYYFRQLMMVAILLDRFLYVTGKKEQPILKKGAAIGIVVCLLISGGFAEYWVYYGGSIFPDTYSEFGDCIDITYLGDPKWSESWWMTFMVNIVLPDAFLTIFYMILLFMLIGASKSKSGKGMEPDDRNVTNVVIGLVLTNFLLRVPFIVVNCIFIYLQEWFQIYSLDATFWENVRYAAPITRQFKETVHAFNFFIFVFIVKFREAFFCTKADK